VSSTLTKAPKTSIGVPHQAVGRTAVTNVDPLVVAARVHARTAVPVLEAVEGGIQLAAGNEREGHPLWITRILNVPSACIASRSRGRHALMQAAPVGRPG
jgi:hypothetical protein